MVPFKLADPLSLSQEVEITTRSEIAERAGFTSTVQDEADYTLRRDLDALLRDTWADALTETRKLSKITMPPSTEDSHKNEDIQLTFRLLSSMKRPRWISLDPKPPPAPLSREPDCEDDKIQAETRRQQALSAAAEFDSLGEAAVSTGRIDFKIPITVRAKVPPCGPLPPLLVTEEDRGNETTRRVKFRGPQTSEDIATSPHEPRPNCVVMPVVSISSQREMQGKKRRKPVRERPPPAYWRPSPDQGKCMGHALGYPSSWAPEQRYVRDTMKKGIESTL